MRVILVRHGKPDIPKIYRFKAREIGRMIELYDSAGIEEIHAPPKELITIAQSCSAVVCSDLPRSIKSAEALGVGRIHMSDAMFRECGLPYAQWPMLKLSPYLWVGIFRALWFMGFSAHSESFPAAKHRAKNGAEKLREIAEEFGDVLFVGHFLFNRFVAQYLRRNGWSGPASPGRKYWEFAEYTL
jgi:broad specificity phosphatase PhoE